MMILRSSPPSPFGRQIKIAAELLGVMDQITIEAADTTDPNDTLMSNSTLIRSACCKLSTKSSLLCNPARTVPRPISRFKCGTKRSLNPIDR